MSVFHDQLLVSIDCCSLLMGNRVSALDRSEKAKSAKARSDALDLQIEEDRQKLRNEGRILVLGASFP